MPMLPHRKYGPSVRLLLEQYGLPDGAVTGSGPHGELLKGDVLQYIKQHDINKQPQQCKFAVTAAFITKTIVNTGILLCDRFEFGCRRRANVLINL